MEQGLSHRDQVTPLRNRLAQKEEQAAEGRRIQEEPGREGVGREGARKGQRRTEQASHTHKGREYAQWREGAAG